MTSLTSESFHVDRDIRQASSLPASSFASHEVLQRERDTVFCESWLMAPETGHDSNTPGLLASLQQAKSYHPIEVLERPLYLHRSADGALRCFSNVCTHAWYPVVTKPGRGNVITCGQHGRRFDCHGRFVSQPSFGDMPNFPRACDHLDPIPLAQWRNLCFVCLGKPRFDFARIIAPLSASLERLPIEDFRRVPHENEVRHVDGNWKQHAWNFMDKFHVPFIHRGPNGLIDQLDYTRYNTELYDHAALQWAWAKNPEHGFDPELLPDRFRDPSGSGKRVLALWWFLYPNLALNFYPWGLSLNRYEPVFDDPKTTRFVWHHYVMDEAKYARRDRIWQNQRVDQEDVVAMALVRRGIESGWAKRGRFAPGDEAGPHWFHRTTFEHLFGDDHPPRRQKGQRAARQGN